MKNKTVIILCMICLIVGSIASGVPVYYLTRCTGGTVKIVGESKTSEPKFKVPPDKAVACGPTITISGAMREGRFFTVFASNDCMNNDRTWELAGLCPQRVRPYSFMVQAHALAGYNREIMKMNALVGGTVSWLWNFKTGGIGVGITYLHGLVVDEWYAGATVTGKLDFGKLQQEVNPMK